MKGRPGRFVFAQRLPIGGAVFSKALLARSH